MTCSKLDSCDKVKMVLDKDLSLDCVYIKIIKRVCARCKGEDN